MVAWADENTRSIRLLKKLGLLISSVLSARDLPFYYRWAGELSLTSLVPDELINQPSELLDYAFGVYEEEDKALLHHYLRNANPAYVRWALKSILLWDNDEAPLNVVQVHGTNDRVIPMPSQVHFKIENAGHMMVYNRADEVSEVLDKVLGADV